MTLRKLRICLATTFYPPYNFGGDGIFVQRLARALARRGHDIHVLHSLDSFAALSDEFDKVDVQPEEPGITVHTLTAGGLSHLELLLNHQTGGPVLVEKEVRNLLTDRFDVIHFHNVSLIGGPKVLSYGRALKLCTLHDYWFVCPMHVLFRNDTEACTQRSCLTCTVKGRRPPQLWRYNGTLTDATRHVDHFIAPSTSSIRLHHANGFPSPIKLLPHFVPEPTWSEMKPEILDNLKTGSYFLYAGRLEKIKGVQILLEAFRKYSQADLIIAGAGGYEHHLRHQAEDLPHVHFTGAIDSQTLNVLYKNAIATVVPSLAYETFGLVIAESFANGTPVIAKNIGALPEVVVEGGGMLYDELEALLNNIKVIHSDKELRARLSREALLSFQRDYTEEIHINRYLNMIYENVPDKTGQQRLNSNAGRI